MVTNRKHRRPARRDPLNRDRVLRAALALADEEGLEALTMRRLGQELGVEAMSLYNHVENKDDLLRGVVDLVLEETELPAEAKDWAAAIRLSAMSVHAALTRHRWAPPLVMGSARPARIRYVDTLLRRLREAGFSPDETYHAYHVLDAHIFGFSLWENTHAANAGGLSSVTDFLDRMIPRDEYPYLREHADQHFTDGPHRDASAFELALDLILDGLKRKRRARS